MADAMQTPRAGRDADERVGRAERRDGCGQHDAGDDEEDDAGHCARAEKQRHHDRDRRDDKRSKTAIKDSHVLDHCDHPPTTRYACYESLIFLPAPRLGIGTSTDRYRYFPANSPKRGGAVAPRRHSSALETTALSTCSAP